LEQVAKAAQNMMANPLCIYSRRYKEVDCCQLEIALAKLQSVKVEKKRGD